ncbi:MAG TPA: hypothetical protein VFZ66_14140 [Herpetosiphonaceae bacterium]
MSMLAGLLLLLAACGSGAASNGGQSATPAPADQQAQGGSQPGAPATPGTADEGALPLAVLTRSGGIQGSTETLVVQSDGLLRLIDGDIGGQPLKEARATAAQIDTLKAAVQAEGWQQLQETYGAQTPDAYAYTISANSKTITTYDGAQNPPLLDDVLRQLNDLWQHALTS